MMFRPDPKPLKRFNKRKSQLDQYKIDRVRYLIDNPICEKCHTKHSDQIHHKKGRIGVLLIDLRHFMAVCDLCHKYIELNPLEAKEKGWSVSRLSL